MPKITLENGTEVSISQESYDALAKAVKMPNNYDEIAKELFSNKNTYWLSGSHGYVHNGKLVEDNACTDSTNAKTEQQLESILALNMWLNVAEYLNDGWKPNWKDKNELKYFPKFLCSEQEIVADYWSVQKVTLGPWFKSSLLVKKSIEILGKETCKKALGIYE